MLNFSRYLAASAPLDLEMMIGNFNEFLFPNQALEEGEIPVVEWWDYYILEDANYESLEERGSSAINYEVITNLIEHPLQLPPPTEVVDKPVREI